MRLGTYYRNLIWKSLGIKADGYIVLDVGSFDGYWLSRQSANIKICIDKNPIPKHGNIIYIKADGLALPFLDKSFDQVYAFDVIEHIYNDKHFIHELYRVTKENGHIIISTPHKYISIFPPFLTNWVSKKWGHDRVNGYLENELKEMAPTNVDIKFFFIREYFYRLLYLPLRFFWGISNIITKPMVRIIAFIDTIFLRGNKGHIIITFRKCDEISFL